MTRLSGGRPRGREGFTVLEVAISGFVLAVAVSGLAAATVYQRNLERSTDRLWKAASTATSTLEAIREDSLAGSAEVAGWDERTMDPKGVGDKLGSRLRARVIDDPSLLDDPDGMWSAGAAAPNYYLVRVGADADDAEFAGALRLETYVANRRALAGPPGEGEAGGEPLSAGTPGETDDDPVDDASRMSPDVSVASVSGVASDRVTVCLTNATSQNLAVDRVRVQLGDKQGYTYVALGDLVLLDEVCKPKRDQRFDLPRGSGSLAPGPLEIVVVGERSVSGSELVLTLEFEDRSQASWRVQL